MTGQGNSHQFIRAKFIQRSPVTHVSIRNLVHVPIAHDTFFFIDEFISAYLPKVAHIKSSVFYIILDKNHQQAGNDHRHATQHDGINGMAMEHGAHQQAQNG